MKPTRLTAITAVLTLCVLSACVRIPDNIQPVDNFKIHNYVGKWYEIARLDHAFERGLSRVTAEYSLRPDGGIAVINRGYSAERDQWKQAEGRAYFVKSPYQGFLKVSFFGPFFGSYIVFELDHDDYQYALVSGPNTSYFWILARTAQIESKLQAKLIARARAAGFDTDALIFVEHE